MKKQVMIIAALMAICMTGCDTAVMSGSDSSTADTVTTIAALSTTDRMESSQTEVVTTKAAVSTSESNYSVDDLVGEWMVPDTFGMNNNSMTVQSDGTFYLRYAAGGTRIGKVRMEQVEGKSYYVFCEDDGMPYLQYACGEQPVNQLNSEQEGGMNFVRISLEDVAISKMDNMTFLIDCFVGGFMAQVDEKETVIVGEATYALLDDARLRALDSNGKIAFEKLIEQTTSGALKDEWLNVLEQAVVEQDGKAYVRTTSVYDYHIFETRDGVTITDRTETSFTATTKASNQMEGCGSAHFVFDGVEWTADSFSFE